MFHSDEDGRGGAEVLVSRNLNKKTVIYAEMIRKLQVSRKLIWVQIHSKNAACIFQIVIETTHFHIVTFLMEIVFKICNKNMSLLVTW